MLLQGNATTGGCCSKCWRDKQKKEENDKTASPCVRKLQPSQPPKVSTPEIQPVVEKLKEEEPTESKVKTEEEPKKKKATKKQSYKSMMANMMTAQNVTAKAEKEKEALRKVTGGGDFTKIEKI